MKVSYKWINEYLNNKAPSPEKIKDLLTMHSMEVEGLEVHNDDTVIDVKTLPNNSHSCLCHRGIAREMGVIADIKVNKYSREFKDIQTTETYKKLKVTIEDNKKCPRYIGRVVENVKVGPSPKWLVEKLETLGQRSINNIVDATNFVMLEIGQPMHAFDADKIGDEIVVKNATAGQKITTLDKKEVELDESILLITDGKNPLAIAGIKGGNFAELENNTKNIILESANFNAVLVRKTAQKIKIGTDASKRYENDLTPELCDEAMDILTKLIVEIAGTEDTKVGEVVDVYPRKANPYKLGISHKEASAILGIEIKDSDIEDIFNRFGFEYKKVKPIDEALELSKILVGTPYKLGSSITYDAPRFFDCSGFIGYVFSQSGIQIPRISVDQYVFGKKIEESDLQPGDVIFSNTQEGKIFFETIEFLPNTKIPEGVDHCGIYLGENKVIHATALSNGVVIEDVNTSIRFKHIVGYRRFSDNSERYVITVPKERLDLRIKEDLAEEIGRIYGYEKIKDISLPETTIPVKIEKGFAYREKIRRILYMQGFSEVMNYSFVSDGEIELANPMSPEKKFLRTNLASGLKDCLESNVRYTDLIDMPQIKIFEFGHIFKNSGEKSSFIIGVKNPLSLKKPKEKETLDSTVRILSERLGVDFVKINKDENISEFDFDELINKLPEINEYEISEIGDKTRKYKKISQYPFMIRDIAVFTPEGTKAEDVLAILEEEAGELMLKNKLFDVFTKTFEDGSKKTSYAYRIIFQSYDRTLTEEEINTIMTKITEKMNSHKGWQVR